jgi:hypothetical protein
MYFHHGTGCAWSIVWEEAIHLVLHFSTAVVIISTHRKIFDFVRVGTTGARSSLLSKRLVIFGLRFSIGFVNFLDQGTILA